MIKQFCITLLLVCSSLAFSDESIREVRNDFDYLFWHESSEYTLFSVKSDSSVSQLRVGYRKKIQNENIGSVTLFLDQKEGEKPYYYCKMKEALMGDWWHCEIHISNINEMNTSSWNHGKFGSGSTTRLH